MHSRARYNLGQQPHRIWDNERIVTVDEQGTVEFQGVGETVILVTNGEVEQVIAVQN